VNKTASAAQLASAFCFMLIHVQLQLPAAWAQAKASYSFFNGWYNSIFGYNL